MTAPAKKSKSCDLDFFICAAGTTSFSRRLTSFHRKADTNNDVALLVQMMCCAMMWATPNDVALCANKHAFGVFGCEAVEMFTDLFYNEAKKGGEEMIFNTHDRTPKIKTNKTLKIMLSLCWCLMGALFLFAAIATSIMSRSILPALIILIPAILIVTFVIVTTINMNKAYVQIDGESITVVDYYFFSRKEKCFTIDKIQTAEIALGYSFRVRGYRYSMMGFSYIVFRNDNNKYLFKVINCPETNEFFNKYFTIQ